MSEKIECCNGINGWIPCDKTFQFFNMILDFEETPTWKHQNIKGKGKDLRQSNVTNSCTNKNIIGLRSAMTPSNVDYTAIVVGRCVNKQSSGAGNTRIRKRSNSVLWQNPFDQRKTKTANSNCTFWWLIFNFLNFSFGSRSLMRVQYLRILSIHSRTGIRQGTLEIVIDEVLWSIQDLIKQYEVPLSRMLSSSLSKNHANSGTLRSTDFDETFHKSYHQWSKYDCTTWRPSDHGCYGKMDTEISLATRLNSIWNHTSLWPTINQWRQFLTWFIFIT